MSEDLISRQAAIDALYDWSEHSMTDAEAWHIRQVIGDIKSLPSAQPERQKGKWIAQKGGGYRCSECKHYALDERDGNFIHVSAKTKFCPYCGADMRGEQDDEP